ncbi:MAG: LON peptidase substrate-binding domain-containing protein, partial [Ignavibacteriales bacterium]|nr:LON peptidase substrate-binding domain-containing protein [Ignavibacteriales bacterium]
MKADSKDKKEVQTVVENIPKELPVLPLRDNVIFPYMIFPLLVGRDQSIKPANYSLENSKFIFLAAQKKSNIEEPTKDDIYTEGTIAKIIQILKLPNGLMKILVDGVIQGRILRFTREDKFFEAEVEIVISTHEDPKELNALIRQMSNLFKEYVKISKSVPTEAISAFDNIDEPDRKVFYVAANISQSIEVKQSIIQKFSIKDQIFTIIKILTSEIDILKIEKEIESKVQENIS